MEKGVGCKGKTGNKDLKTGDFFIGQKELD